MSDTKRRPAHNLFSRERKPYRKTHTRQYRKAVRRFIRQAVFDRIPRYRRTSGWLTW